jgi:2-polyprenyl-3-methyl-5-hydroxy-6-metoxy-1,4-benzoquinol methylase
MKAMDEKALTACRICSSNECEPHLEKSGVQIYQCQSCGVQFWNPEHIEEMEKIYSRDYFVSESAPTGYNNYFSLEQALRKVFRKRLKRMKKMNPGIATCLEVGSGPGFFLDEAARFRIRATGVEVSEFACAWGRNHLNISLIAGKVEDLSLPRDSFDVACMWDVIEHLPNPVSTLRHIRGLLKSGGELWLSTGDAGSLAARLSGKRWHLYNIPEHLFFFNGKSIRKALQLAGFEMRLSFHETVYVPLSYIRERLVKTLNLPLPFLKKSKILIPINLFDVMTVYAKKSSDV